MLKKEEIGLMVCVMEKYLLGQRKQVGTSLHVAENRNYRWLNCLPLCAYQGESHSKLEAVQSSTFIK